MSNNKPLDQPEPVLRELGCNGVVMDREPQAGDWWMADGKLYYCVGMCPAGRPVWLRKDEHGNDAFGRFEAERFPDRQLLSKHYLWR